MANAGEHCGQWSIRGGDRRVPNDTGRFGSYALGFVAKEFGDERRFLTAERDGNGQTFRLADPSAAATRASAVWLPARPTAAA